MPLISLSISKINSEKVKSRPFKSNYNAIPCVLYQHLWVDRNKLCQIEISVINFYHGNGSYARSRRFRGTAFEKQHLCVKPTGGTLYNLRLSLRFKVRLCAIELQCTGLRHIIRLLLICFKNSVNLNRKP